MSPPVHQLLEIVGEGGRQFRIVLPRAEGPFAASVKRVVSRNNNYHFTPHVGVLALDYLRGRGTLIDVGANIGLLSIPAAVYGSRVVAIELLPENCLYLDLAILKNRLGNIALYQLAAGADRRLVGSAGSEAWGQVMPAGVGLPAAQMPLDDIVALADLRRGGRVRPFVKPPLLIKIDTEGYEFAVLRGAGATIARFNPALIVECIATEGAEPGCDHQSRAVKAYLEENGYHLYLHRGNRLAPRTADDLQEGPVCDFFASRRRYREGERIGRFVVGPLAFAESLSWVAEMAEYRLPQHRLHAAGVIARWAAEGRRSVRLDELGRRLLDDPDPSVAEAAARLRLPHG